MSINGWHDPVRWTLRRIRETELTTEPYVHLVVDDVFPPWYYREMIAMSPEPLELVAPEIEPGVERTNWRQGDLVPDPGVEKAAGGSWLMGLRDWEEYQHLGPATRLIAAASYWRDFRRSYMSSNALRDGLTQKFLGAIVHWGLAAPTADSITVGRLAYDGLDAGLGPHTDRADKLISMVFYLADDSHDSEECRRGMGTQVCRPADPGFEPDPNRHYTWDEYEPAGTVEYVPNRLICWPVTPDSVHAYHQTVDQWRRTLKLFVQTPEDPEAVQARIAESQKHAAKWRETV